MRALVLAGLVALAPMASHAAEDPHVRALAAGYKAAFLCSGIFNAGQTQAQVAADDLEGVYPAYQALVRELPATVDRQAKTVSVAFDPQLPPRVAAWRPVLGCAQLPIGAAPETARRLPQASIRAPELDDRPWPLGDARARAPVTRGMSPVETVASRAFSSYGGRTTAVVVVRRGRIVAERYREGYGLHTPQRTWSAAKSLTAALVGRAVQLGRLKVEDPAQVPEWQAPGDPRAQITLVQLLHMGSGLWTDGPGNRTDEVYLGGGAVTEQATRMPLEVKPGTRFRYANNDTLLAARSLRAALGDGQTALEFPFRELLWEIGMTHTTPETDWRGNYVLSSQVWTTARDLARLGLLFLNDGVWQGERLLPEGWSRFVATPAPAQPPSGPGYGAFFWLFGPEQGLPEGTYAMRGNRGQYVYIVPSRDVVVVRRGFDAADGPQFQETKFVADVLAALP